MIYQQAQTEQSLAEQAYHLLEEALVMLRLPPGELISEKQLVDIAGIGRTPVREAVQKLSAEGMLQILPRKGLMVTALKRSELAAILEVRRVMERLMVVKSAERATDPQRQALQALAAHSNSINNNHEMIFRLGYHLDELLDVACHNTFLVKALAAPRSQCRRLCFVYREQLALQGQLRLIGGLARAVADGDAAGAIRAMDENIAMLERLVGGMDVIS